MPKHTRPKTPSAKRFLEAFGGRIYKPLAKNVVTIPGPGWGGSGDSYGDAISHLSLRFELGAAKESVIVEISTNPWHAGLTPTLVHLFFEFERLGRPRFPVVIERGKQKVPVDGLEYAFTTYTAGPVAVAVGTVDDLTVMVRCRTRRLGKLALGLIEPAELRTALRR